MNLGHPRLFLIILLFSNQVFSEPLLRVYANFKLLDKTSNKVFEKSIKVDESDFIETLNIRVYSCFTEPPNKIPENYVLIEVNDNFNNNEELIYKGWMISSSPDLTPLEHPIYDLWLLGCSNDNTS